jgi:hypothetical protein
MIEKNWVEILESWQDTILGKRNYEYPHFHSEINNANTLVVTAGDSWTWGGGLGNGRLDQVYGKLLSTQFNADWINIGCSGWSNSYILLVCQHLVSLLKHENYKRIIFVITLTENGRDACTPESYQYDYIKCSQKNGINDQFFEQVLLDTELYWADQIKTLTSVVDNRFKFFVGQNFVWHENLYTQLKNTEVIVGNNNWIELLANYQNLSQPIRTNLVCGWIFELTSGFGSVVNILQIKDLAVYKSWALPYIERANLVNKWLDQSPMNYKKATKHPVKEGHKIWADYIINQLESNV